MGRGVTIWLTGLSGAGKTTIARRVEQRLLSRGIRVERLDGDVVRQTLTRDLGFSREDRDRNIERVTFVAKLLTRNGVVVLASFISPYRAARERSRTEIGEFLEVYVRASLETLKARDVKGLYRKAAAGELRNFTGVDDPYEAPERPDLVCDTDRETEEESAAKVLALLDARGMLSGSRRAPAVAERGESWPAGPAVPGPIPPHGGVLVDREVRGEELRDLLARARTLPSIRLDDCERSDVELIGTGAYSPLDGFMRRADYDGVVDSMRLGTGLLWPLPITLAVAPETARRLDAGREVRLSDGAGEPVAVLSVAEVYPYDRRREAERVYGTTDDRHPGVARLYGRAQLLVGGRIRVLRHGGGEFRGYRLTPLETRREFDARGWRTVAAFQTRNPVHRAHEYLQKVALELVDGLLLHPLVGTTKADDVPAAVRLRSYEAVLRGYFPVDRALLAVYPAAMRYAGPREAVFHAVCRQNYGCTHIIIGRDHAGVDRYYGPYEAQRIFDGIGPDELGIVPLRFEPAFYCRVCGNTATRKTCPHGAAEHVAPSGTQVREMLARGELPPPEFTRPEAARILSSALRMNAAVAAPAGG